MIPQGKQQRRLTINFNRPKARKRPLQRGNANRSAFTGRLLHDKTLRCFVVLMMMHSWSLSCTAFHTSKIAMRPNKICSHHRKERDVAIRRVHTPYERKNAALLSVQKSADDAFDVIIGSTNATGTNVSANQSTLLLLDHSSPSNTLLQQLPQPSQQQQQPVTATVSTTPNGSSPASFGDVVNRRERPIMYDSESEHALISAAPSKNTTSTNTPSFGDVVSIRKSLPTTPVTPVVGTTISEERQVANQIRLRNTVVALLSIAAAIGNFVYQYLHPIEPIQILFALQQSSADVSVVGKNHKPTIIDFWAPWCENCKLSAATLQSIEKQYGNDVNFILINGDLASSWPYIEALGVDAIPHMSMISYDGVVETALIGPIPKHIIQEDIDVLLLNSRNNAEAIRTNSATVDPNESSDNRDTVKDQNQQLSPEHVELPHKMLDVFAGKPASARRVQFGMNES